MERPRLRSKASYFLYSSLEACKISVLCTVYSPLNGQMLSTSAMPKSSTVQGVQRSLALASDVNYTVATDPLTWLLNGSHLKRSVGDSRGTSGNPPMYRGRVGTCTLSQSAPCFVFTFIAPITRYYMITNNRCKKKGKKGVNSFSPRVNGLKWPFLYKCKGMENNLSLSWVGCSSRGNRIFSIWLRAGYSCIFSAQSWWHYLEGWLGSVTMIIDQQPLINRTN